MTNNKSDSGVVLYTDGSCLGNPGPGGWAAVIHNDKTREISGGFSRTTNNRMEINALVQALKNIPENSDVTAYTDSKYLHDALDKGWLKKWQKNGWKTASKSRVKNKDLWEELVAMLEKHNLNLKWVPAHTGQKENERCDYLAKTEAQKPNLPIDKGYE